MLRLVKGLTLLSRCFEQGLRLNRFWWNLLTWTIISMDMVHCYSKTPGLLFNLCDALFTYLIYSLFSHNAPSSLWLNSFGLLFFFFTAISPALETLSSTVQAVDKYMLGTMLSLSATVHKMLLVDMSDFPISQGLTNIFWTGPVSKYWLFCRPQDSCYNYSIPLLKHDNNHSEYHSS